MNTGSRDQHFHAVSPGNSLWIKFILLPCFKNNSTTLEVVIRILSCWRTLFAFLFTCQKQSAAWNCKHPKCYLSWIEAATGGTKKAFLKSFINFTGKQLHWSLFLIKFQVFRSETLLKRVSNTGFFCEACGIFKNTCFE